MFSIIQFSLFFVVFFFIQKQQRQIRAKTHVLYVDGKETSFSICLKSQARASREKNKYLEDLARYFFFADPALAVQRFRHSSHRRAGAAKGEGDRRAWSELDLLNVAGRILITEKKRTNKQKSKGCGQNQVYLAPFGPKPVTYQKQVKKRAPHTGGVLSMENNKKTIAPEHTVGPPKSELFSFL